MFPASVFHCIYLLPPDPQYFLFFISLHLSVSSSTTSISSKYDPELLKADLAVSKERVRRLKQELAQINSEISFTQRGVATLYEWVPQIEFFSKCSN